MDSQNESGFRSRQRRLRRVKSMVAGGLFVLGALMILAAGYYLFWPTAPVKTPTTGDDVKIAASNAKDTRKDEAESAAKTPAAQEPINKAPLDADTTGKGISPNKELPSTAPVAKEPPVKDPKAIEPPQGPATKDLAPTKPATKDPLSRDALPNEPIAKEPTAKEPPKTESTPPDVRRPPTTDAPEDLYAKDAWGRFAPGSWSKMRLRQTGGAPIPEIELKDTFKSASDKVVEVQRETTGKLEPLEFKYQPDFLIGIDIDIKTWKQAMRIVQHIKDEELTIAGKKITTKYVTIEYDFGGKKILGQFWIAADVPGAVVRIINSFDAVRFERELVDFEIKQPIR